MGSTEELTQRIAELEKENKELLKWQEGVNRLLNQMLDIVSGQGNAQKELECELQNLKRYASINRYRINSLPYELQDPDHSSFFYKPHILSVTETREKLSKEHRSLSRFGDGEFAAIVLQKRWNFQKESEILSEKLKTVLSGEDENLLIGLHPTFYMNLSDMPEDLADGVRAYMQPMVRRLHAQLLSPDKIYANALFHNIENDDDVNELKEIWNDRDCVFVEGVHTCMGVGNDLFDNCQSIERILGPAENAVDRYDEIMREVLKQPKNKLVLLALGPTATALAYDLDKEGYQAVDIGHVDLIYESYVRKLMDINNVEISYKYCRIDECVSGRIIETSNDPKYRSQIVAVVD